MKHKTNLVFWFYIVTILTFNDFTGLYVSKMSLRVMYISLIAIWLFLSFFSSDGKMSLTKSGTVVSGYTVYVAFRFVFQLVSDEKVTGVTIISFAQLFLPIIGFFMAQKLDSHDRKRIERHFCLCTVVSVLMGFIDSAVHFLPKQELYAYVSDGNVVLRGYSMAGSALITGFICALSASFVLGSKKNVVQKKYLYISMFAISILGLLKSYSRGAMAFFLIDSRICL